MPLRVDIAPAEVSRGDEYSDPNSPQRLVVVHPTPQGQKRLPAHRNKAARAPAPDAATDATMYPSARYGRPRRDDRYEPDVVYVEDRRAPRRYDDYNDDRLRRSYEHRRETERETERDVWGDSHGTNRV